MRLTRWGGYWRGGLGVDAMVADGHLAFLVERCYFKQSLINICCSYSLILSISCWSHQINMRNAFKPILKSQVSQRYQNILAINGLFFDWSMTQTPFGLPNVDWIFDWFSLRHTAIWKLRNQKSELDEYELIFRLTEVLREIFGDKISVLFSNGFRNWWKIYRFIL